MFVLKRCHEGRIRRTTGILLIFSFLLVLRTPNFFMQFKWKIGKLTSSPIINP